MAYSNLPLAAPVAPTGSSLPGAGLPPAGLDFEAAHAELRRAALMLEHDVDPVIDLGPAARAMEHAFSAVYDAFDGRSDPLEAARVAVAEIERAATALDGAAELDPGFGPMREHLGRARAYLGRAEERLARLPRAAVPEPSDLVASIDVPRLHVLARSSLAPTLRIPKSPLAGFPAPPPEPLPTPRSFEEMRLAIAELKRQAAGAKRGPRLAALEPSPATARIPPVAPPGFTKTIPAVMDEGTFLRSRTRECFEEVAMVGMQRAPLLGDPWRGSLLLERRMLASIDVIAAIGPTAIEHVPQLVADAPVKDPSRGFAIAMVLGCIGGRDALAAAEHALLTSERDAAFIDELGAALKLVPHDLVALGLRTLLGEADPAIRAMAIDVLGYRGLASTDELTKAAMDVPVVAARALLHLACAPGPELPGLLQAASTIDDAPLREAVWTAMALSNHPHTEVTLSAALGGPEAGAAAVLLALAGDEQDAGRLSQRAFEAPVRALVTAVGWAGGAWSIGPLIALLEKSEDDEVRFAAAYALERITGAGLWEDVEVPEDEILVPEPPEPDVGEPRVPKLARMIGDPRDPPAEPAPELIEHPTTDPARWRAYWHDKGPGYDMSARYRRGQLYTPLVSLGELDTGRCTPGERRLLQRELILRTGGFVRFDPHDFVVVQEEAIRAWQPIARRASSAPGKWVRPQRRAG